MDVILIFNGLGNQMSQYAFYLAKKNRNKKCFAIYDTKSLNGHNGYELGRLFSINCDKGIMHWLFQIIYRIHNSGKLALFNKIFFNKFIRNVSEAKNYDYNPEFLNSYPAKGINYFWGGWHSEKNFLEVKDEVKNAFQFPRIDDERCLYYVDKISRTENSVSLHIRRGDYLNVKPDDFYQYNEVATPAYYKSAMNIMNSKFGNCKFFVFSNDLEWCRKEFNNLDVYFVDCNIGKDSWRDMFLMTLCNHHIIANSTFSWWGAWLSNREGLTICPERFLRTVETKDFYPDRWVKISSEGDVVSCSINA